MNCLIPAARAAAIASLVLSASAHAYTVAECVGDTVATRSAIENATTFLSARDETALADKATSAGLKIGKAKLYDALSILSSMSAKVDELSGAAKPKLGPADAAAVKAEIATAAVCVNGLLTQP